MTCNYPYTQITVVADTNDADYVTSSRVLHDEDASTILKWGLHLKRVGGNWSTRREFDEGELARDLYADVFTDEEFATIKKYIPSSEYGVHTIKSITLQEISSERKLF